ncbi:MAG TPA: hypothetical protein VJR03_00900 [Nitrospira sp.]|nr:hypothetical protein [Nitrospira sp.]
MGQVFRSGAFLQQCWSVHPLCLGVKRITAEHQLALACTSCRFAHYVTMSSVVVGAAAASEQVALSMDPLAVRSEAGTLLASCLQTHAAALSLREMDVFEDLVVIRCAECRRHYAVTVAAFETHQK